MRRLEKDNLKRLITQTRALADSWEKRLDKIFNGGSL
jgi:hypothetical protein